MKVKSIRGKLLLYFIPLSVIVLVITGLVVGILAMNSSHDQADESSKELVRATARIVEEWLLGMKDELRDLSITDVVKSFDPARYTPRFKEIIKESDGVFELIFLADPTGKAISEKGETVNVGDRDYFQDVMFKGKKFTVSEGFISRFSNDPVFYITHAVYDNAGKLAGVLGAAVTLKTLDAKMESIKIGKAGYTYLVDGTGMIITHAKNKEYVLKLNVLEGSSVGYKHLEEAGKEMIRGNSGEQDIVRPTGEKQTLFFTPVPNTPNWSLAGAMYTSEIQERSLSLLWVVIISFVLIIAIIVAISIIVGTIISRSLKKLAIQVDKFGQGDLTTTFEAKGHDEIAQIAIALSEMGKDLREAVASIASATKEVKVASNNLADVSEKQLAASEELALQSQSASANLNNTASSIEEVNSGVEEVAASAQNVAKTAQALSAENEKTADRSRKGEEVAAEAGRETEATAKQTLLAAQLVQKLAENSKNVGEIVETISSIAEQTNLLALNAAIEAARAGEAGRGFAVVADEIRKLAEESKRATSNIGSILKEVQKDAGESHQATDKTAVLVQGVNEKARAVVQQFKQLLTMVDHTTEMVENLTATSQEQGAAAEEMASAMATTAKSVHEISEQIKQMTEGIEIQAQGAHQVSAAAEELDSLAENLTAQVAHFKF